MGAEGVDGMIPEDPDSTERMRIVDDAIQAVSLKGLKILFWRHTAD